MKATAIISPTFEFVSIRDFILKTQVDNSVFKGDHFREMAFSSNLPNIYNHKTESYKFQNLENLLIPMQAYCPWKAHKAGSVKNVFSCSIDHPTKTKKQYLYMLKLYKCGVFRNVIKVGIARSPKERVENLNLAWSSLGITFSIYKVSSVAFIDACASRIETGIHTALKAKGLQYLPNHQLDGYTELFHYSEWMDNLI